MIPATFKSSIENALSEKLKVDIRITADSSVGGGCINDAHKLEATAGTFFLKYNDARKYPRMFDAEARGLSLLRSANALKIPGVILSGEAEGKSFLILEYIESGKKQKNFWKDFGINLAKLHQETSSSFGLDHDNYIGSLPQSNTQHPSWTEFFITERIEPQLRLATSAQSFSNSLIFKFSNLCQRLPEIIPLENPSLLHGDLWNGNYVIAADGSTCLIDPAVYYGHREMDLAMTRLFGGFSEEFYEAYQNAFPLAPGFEERVDICNLYPLLVHVNLFGGGYISQVKSILSRF